jgi:ABC-2 type transport system ATP-binding protein
MALLGRNGAGKSTIIKLAIGALRPHSGRLSGWSELSVGYLPEDRGLYAHLTAEEHLRHFARIGGVASPREAASAWLDRLGLGRYRRCRARALSKGNAQRLQLGLALVSDPELIILDEPFTGLDLDAQADLAALLDELAPGRFLMVSSHNLGLVDRVCSDAILVDDGEITARGPVAFVGYGGGERFAAARV